MAYHSSQDHLIAGQLDLPLKIEHLTSRRFDKQTDAVQLAFAVAQMTAQQGCEVVLVDGLIETTLQTEAVNHPRGPQAYFSQRCHDKGLTCRRIIFLDAKPTRTMNPKATGAGILHAHGLYLLGPGETHSWLRKKLRAVFGTAGNARKFQFNICSPDDHRSHSFAGQKCYGAIGKLAYMLSHVGTTCNRMKLNEGGKRSRKAPIRRARVNRQATGLAKGVPSNFVGEVLIWDTKTRRIAREAFDAWYSKRIPARQEKPRRSRVRDTRAA